MERPVIFKIIISLKNAASKNIHMHIHRHTHRGTGDWNGKMLDMTEKYKSDRYNHLFFSTEDKN